MSDFSAYLQDYMNIKRLQGVTPGQRTSEAVFAPYFNRQYDINRAGQQQGFAERELATRTGQQGEALAWGKERTLSELAGAKDINMSKLASEKDITMSRLAGAKDITMSELSTEEKIAQDRLTAQRDITTGELDVSKEIALNALALQKELQAGKLSWNKEKTIAALALEKWVQQLMIEQASRSDTRSTIGNVIGSLGSVAQLPLLKKYGYLGKR